MAVIMTPLRKASSVRLKQKLIYTLGIRSTKGIKLLIAKFKRLTNATQASEAAKLSVRNKAGERLLLSHRTDTRMDRLAATPSIHRKVKMGTTMGYESFLGSPMLVKFIFVHDAFLGAPMLVRFIFDHRPRLGSPMTAEIMFDHSLFP